MPWSFRRSSSGVLKRPAEGSRMMRWALICRRTLLLVHFIFSSDEYIKKRACCWTQISTMVHSNYTFIPYLFRGALPQWTHAWCMQSVMVNHLWTYSSVLHLPPTSVCLNLFNLLIITTNGSCWCLDINRKVNQLRLLLAPMQTCKEEQCTHNPSLAVWLHIK